MTGGACVSCRRETAGSSGGHACGVCGADVCRKCAEFLDADSFRCRTGELPADLRHSYYCPACFDEKVAPALEEYREILDRARGVFIFFKTQKRAPKILRRSKRIVRVEECADRDETILRLGFCAAEAGYNAVVGTEVVSRKVRDEAYQKMVWQGSGEPVEVDASRLEREDEWDAGDRFR